jgi:hypothetical protein
MPPERRSFSIEMYPRSLDKFEFPIGNALAAAEGMIP